MKSRLTGLAIAVVILVACAPTGPEKTTMRVCDADGCRDRPKDFASYDPPNTESQTDADGRLDALRELAAEEPAAAYDLGLRYFRGDGVRQDSYQALQWMRDAAERGNLDAQKALGRFYLSGLEEMGSDPREAQRWLAAAAAQGDEEAAALLEEAEAARQAAAEAYEERQAEWRRMARRYWYHKAPYRWRWREGYWDRPGY